MGEAGETGTADDAAETRTDRGGRPTGVTILSVLAFLQGLLLLVGGATMLVLGSAIPGLGALPAGVLAGVGGVFVLIGLVYFLAGWGLLTGENWAWILSIVLAVIGLFAFPIGTVISIIILYYLTRPKVKRFFGRGQAQAA